MDWNEIFTVFVLSHVVGDFLLQTDWQARNKRTGLFNGGPENRRALLTHCTSYTLCFVPGLIWVADHHSTGIAIVCAVLIWVTHVIQDDGLALYKYVVTIKKTDAPFGSPLWIFIDQSFHMLILFGVALVAVA